MLKSLLKKIFLKSSENYRTSDFLNPTDLYKDKKDKLIGNIVCSLFLFILIGCLLFDTIISIKK